MKDSLPCKYDAARKPLIDSQARNGRLLRMEMRKSGKNETKTGVGMDAVDACSARCLCSFQTGDRVKTARKTEKEEKMTFLLFPPSSPNRSLFSLFSDGESGEKSRHQETGKRSRKN